MRFFKKRQYYKVEWAFGNKDYEKYSTIVKAYSEMSAGIKVQRRQCFPIYIYSIEKM